MKQIFGKSLCIIVPHPDDEILGAGGTILRAIRHGIEVHILFVSGHLPPLYNPSDFKKIKGECLQACKFLNVTSKEFLEIPATLLNEKPIAELNKEIKNFIDKTDASSVMLPFPDRHIDHKLIFEAGMVCTRPVGNSYPKLVLCYETLSETHWNAPNIEPMFIPEIFIDITDDIEKKLEAMSFYVSQIKNNNSRGLGAIKALAEFRGSQNGFGFAESFKLIRHLI